MSFNHMRENAFNKCPAVFILVKTALILFIIVSLDGKASTQHV